MAALCGLLLGAAAGQAPGAKQPVGTLDSLRPSFERIAAAQRDQNLALIQVRRFSDHEGSLLRLREQLLQEPEVGGEPRFQLRFLGFEGRIASPSEAAHWDSVYASQMRTIVRTRGFRVRDAVHASQNYSLHTLGHAVRLGRPVDRVLVFPRAVDRGIWILDVDQATGLPIYSAEYDTRGRLVGELEVVQLTVGARVSLEGVDLGNPSMVVTEHVSFAAARNAMGNRRDDVFLPDASLGLPGYQLELVRVVENVLSGARHLVLGFGDGIDAYFVVQSDVAVNPLASLPATGDSHVLGHFRDGNMDVHLFTDRGLQFQSAGRASQVGLQGFAKRLYRAALAR